MPALSKKLKGKGAVVRGRQQQDRVRLGQIIEENFKKAFAINKPAHSHKEESPLKGKHSTHSDREIFFEDFAAELTVAAYSVALRHGVGDKWLDLELELWRVLTEMVKKWGQNPPHFSDGLFVCDWAGV